MSGRRLSPHRLEIIRRYLTGDRYMSHIDEIVARMIQEIDALRAERDEALRRLLLGGEDSL